MDRSNPQTFARQAGVAYLAIIVFSIAGYSTLSWLLNGSEPVAARLAEHRIAFASACVASVVGFVAWIVLGLLLYRLMSAAGRLTGLLMLVFVVAGTATNLIAVAQLWPLLRAQPGLGEAAVAAAVHDYNHLLLLAQVFSGLWLFPFGRLVWHSRIAPRLLAFCLMAGGVFYLLVFATAFAPQLERLMAYRIVSTPAGLFGFAGELGMCLWLLFKGARQPHLVALPQ
jgi:uncharacterized protein DUF4386